MGRGGVVEFWRMSTWGRYVVGADSPLKRREATPTSQEFLKKRIVPIDIEGIDTISGILSAFNNTSIQSRNLARCVEIFTRMLEDPDGPTIFLGLAGAMIPAGMKKVISTMVKRKMVDVIVTTGANAYHDLVESFRHYHYKGSPEVNDAELYQRRIDRIYARAESWRIAMF